MVLLRAAAELHDDALVSDRTWSALAASYGTLPLMALGFTVGVYTATCTASNSFGVQRDEELSGFLVPLR